MSLSILFVLVAAGTLTQEATTVAVDVGATLMVSSSSAATAAAAVVTVPIQQQQQQ